MRDGPGDRALARELLDEAIAMVCCRQTMA